MFKLKNVIKENESTRYCSGFDFNCIFCDTGALDINKG